MKSKILPLCVLSLSFVGCEALKVPGKTLEMANTTQGMATTTSELKEGTKRVEGISEDLRYISEQLKLLSIQGLGSESRDKNFERVQACESLSCKLLHATKYQESFDFQLWNMTSDSKILESELMDLYGKHAMLEFTLKMPEVLPEAPDKYELNGLSKDKKMENFYAFAATVHKVNMFQDIFRSSMNLKEITMLDFIEKALDTERAVNAGEIDVEELAKTDKASYESLKSAGQLKYLLQIRYKFLPLVALARISHVNSGLRSKVRMLLKDWAPDFSDSLTNQFNVEELDKASAKKEAKPDRNFDIAKNLNAVQIYYAWQILDFAKQTGEILKRNGITPTLDKKSYMIFSHLKINLADLKDINGDTIEVSEAKMKLIKKFNDELDGMLKAQPKSITE